VKVPSNWVPGGLFWGPKNRFCGKGQGFGGFGFGWSKSDFDLFYLCGKGP
jgi:hypothetical protein